MVKCTIDSLHSSYVDQIQEGKPEIRKRANVVVLGLAYFQHLSDFNWLTMLWDASLSLRKWLSALRRPLEHAFQALECLSTSVRAIGFRQVLNLG
jgi:hypothetical protein